ncbi:MAG: SAM-dependent DNA methyltransferase, partial [Rhodoferax sp.]
MAAKAPEHLSQEQKAFRTKLRAHAKQLGDMHLDNGAKAFACLVDEIAYEQWHRILFTRFLVGNGLLIHPEFEAPMSLADVAELAADEKREVWELASDFASKMLPQIFRPEDPTQQLRLPRNRVQELEKLVLCLGPDTFKANDSLGWSYQFWQAKRKDAINAAGVKIGAAELPAVTQLFTEDYMVEFLLHNSLGAWFKSNHPDVELDLELPYLR